RGSLGGPTGIFHTLADLEQRVLPQAARAGRAGALAEYQRRIHPVDVALDNAIPAEQRHTTQLQVQAPREASSARLMGVVVGLLASLLAALALAWNAREIKRLLGRVRSAASALAGTAAELRAAAAEAASATGQQSAAIAEVAATV